MTKYFEIPFANSGDQTTIPDASQPDGSVSFADGWTPDYEKDQETDPDAKDVSRQGQNYIDFTITEAMKEIQEHGGKPYDPVVNYPVGAIIIGSDGNLYRCLIKNGPAVGFVPVVDPVGDATGTWKNYELSYLNVTDLKASLINPVNNQKVSFLGYYTPGDGGGQVVYWDSASAENGNGITIFELDSAPVNGRFKSVDESILNIRHAGAKIDGVTDDSAAFASASVLWPDESIYLTSGTAVITTGDFIKQRFHTYGTFTTANTTVIPTKYGVINKNITVTVGAGGNFDNINDALGYLSYINPKYSSTNIKAEISLLTGFVMEEQVLNWAVDLSWITITGVDAETTIDGTFLTESPSTGLSAYNSTNRPAFGVYAGGKGPRVGQMFDMNGTGADTAQQRCGVVAYGAGTGIDVLPNCGVRRAAWYGILASHQAAVTAPQSDFNGSLGRGAFANEGGTIEGNTIDLSGATSTAVHASDGGLVTCESANVSNSLIGLSANNGGRINGVDVIADGCSDAGIYSANGSWIQAQNATATGCDIGVRSLSGSWVNADGVDASGCVTFGITCEQGSHINADNVNAQKGGAPAITDVRILTGSTVNFSNGIGGVSNTVNNLTAAGIIFR